MLSRHSDDIARSPNSDHAHPYNARPQDRVENSSASMVSTLNVAQGVPDRACDVCYQRKVRCLRSRANVGPCIPCLNHNVQCTFAERIRRPRRTKEYIQKVEERLERVEKLLKERFPNADFVQESEYAARSVIPLDTLHHHPIISSFLGISLPNAAQLLHEECLPTEDDDFDDGIQHLGTNDGVNGASTFESRNKVLLERTREYKRDLLDVWHPHPSGLSPETLYRRPLFWSTLEWENQSLRQRIHQPAYEFPAPDLLWRLIEVWFTDINCLFPLLHRPTFEQAVARAIHLHDEGFARVLLLLCAVASRFVDDPQVRLESSQPLSAGWKWFRQAQMTRLLLLSKPSLYDVQAQCLSNIFVTGTFNPQATYSITGTGVRLLQQVGAHRRKAYGHQVSVQDELWKRAFWVMIYFDYWGCATMGRACSMQDEEIDADLPIECDDEYWEHPDPQRAFKQPPGKPSTITFFVHLLKLQRIITLAQRTLFSIRRWRSALGLSGPDWETQIVSELDSALNSWKESVPEHLRWKPDSPDTLFYHQGAILHQSYYVALMIIHRPFITRRAIQSPLSLPSRIICTNSARTCAKIVAAQGRRKGPVTSIQLGAAYFSGLVLVLMLWERKRQGEVLDKAKDMVEVHACLDYLVKCQPRWQKARLLHADLQDLADMNGVSLESPDASSLSDQTPEEEDVVFGDDKNSAIQSSFAGTPYPDYRSADTAATASHTLSSPPLPTPDLFAASGLLAATLAMSSGLGDAEVERKQYFESVQMLLNPGHTLTSMPLPHMAHGSSISAQTTSGYEIFHGDSLFASSFQWDDMGSWPEDLGANSTNLSLHGPSEDSSITDLFAKYGGSEWTSAS